MGIWAVFPRYLASRQCVFTATECVGAQAASMRRISATHTRTLKLWASGRQAALSIVIERAGSLPTEDMGSWANSTMSLIEIVASR